MGAKKNIGSAVALYPTPPAVIGAMVNGRPNWALAGHLDVMGHDRITISPAKALLNARGRPDYRRLKPVLFEIPAYEHLKTGDMLGKCMSFAKEAK